MIAFLPMNDELATANGSGLLDGKNKYHPVNIEMAHSAPA
jgi:hypothetical protein